MGNCLESLKNGQEIIERKDEVARVEHEQQKDDCGKEGGLKIKILLTKEELEWLLLVLQQKEGSGLDDLLVKIERERRRYQGWKPSLESIMETPEVLHMDS